MAEEVVIGRVELEGAEQVKQQLDEIGKAGDKAGQGLNQAGQTASKGLGNLDDLAKKAADEIKRLGASFGPLGQAASGAAASFIQMKGALATIGVAIAAIGFSKLITGIFDVAKSAADANEQLRSLAITAGTSSEQFGGFAFALEQSGASAQVLQRAMFVIGDAIGQATEEGSRSVGVFEKLNIALRDSAGRARDPIEVFKEFATQLSKIRNVADQQALAIQAFGRRIGPQLVEAAQQGGAGLQGLADEFARLSGFTKEAGDLGDEFNDSLNRMSTAAASIGNKLGQAFQPALIQAMNGITEALVRIREALQPLFDAFQSLASGTVSLIGSLGNLAAAFDRLGVGRLVSIISPLAPALRVLTGAIDLLGQAFSFAATVINAFADGIERLRELLGIGAADAQKTKQGIEDVGAAAVKTQDEISRINFLGVAGGLSVLDNVKEKTDAASEATKSWVSELLGIDLSSIATKAELAFQQLTADATASRQQIAALNWPGLIDPTQWSVAAQTVFEEILAGANSLFEQLSANVPSIDFSTLATSAEETFERIRTALAGAFSNSSSIFNQLVQTGTSAFQRLGQAANSIPQQIRTAFQGLVSFFSSLGGQIANAMQSGFNALVNAAKEAVQQAISFIEGLIARIGEAIRRLAGLQASGSGAASGGQFAQGGRVYGAGTSTSDSIPAWLSHGEFVIRAAAVKKYGSQLFHALNMMRLPRRFLESMVGGFANGGMPSMKPLSVPLRMADGGQVGSSSSLAPVTLNIGAEQITGLLAPREVVDKLARFGTSQQVRSAGRKPSWYF
jgi:hypothetical protein